MPELPEVEALALDLRGRLEGRAITAVHLAAFSALKTYDPPVSALVGSFVDGVTRHGKFLDIDVSGLHVVLHLARAGWVRWKDEVPDLMIRPLIFSKVSGEKNIEKLAAMVKEAAQIVLRATSTSAAKASFNTDNIRVLKWIAERLDGATAAVDGPLGLVPADGALDLDGTAVTDADLAALFAVDPAAWQAEAELTEEFFATFGDRLPRALATQLATLRRRLA